MTANEDPQHVDYDLESWNGHGFGARLETGALHGQHQRPRHLKLGPASRGQPQLPLLAGQAGLYAPGWFFAFEQNLAIGRSQIVYTDALRQTHSFSGAGSSWSAPNGFLASPSPPTARTG